MQKVSRKGNGSKPSEVVYYIMAGGEGMRLWPLSRSYFPKQLHSLFGESSFLQQTVSRILPQAAADHVLIGTRDDLYFSIKEQWEQLGVKCRPWLILEPVGRNTAPAIAMAILAARQRFGRDVMLVTLAADHVIRNQKRFAQLINTAVKTARKGHIVTFGIVPTYPETGYGYIKLGKKIDRDVFAVGQFKEKPTESVARKYLRSKNYLWNSGMFVFDTAVMAQCLETLVPQVWKQSQRIWQQRQQKPDAVKFSKQSFSRLPKISIDYAVMEKAPRRSVIKADFGWCDVGCWQMVYELSPKDKQGNVFSGDVYSLDTHNTFVRSEKRVVATVGLENAIVIDTPDALLISEKSRTQDVKKIVEQLNEKQSLLTKFHATVYRPWGNYTVLEEGPGYKIKRVVVNPKQQLSLQKHIYRSEHWVVICGKARIVRGEDSLLLRSNESAFIPKGCRHRIVNPGTKELVIIEVQTGSQVNEEDIIRFQDVYERI